MRQIWTERGAVIEIERNIDKDNARVRDRKESQGEIQDENREIDKV